MGLLCAHYLGPALGVVQLAKWGLIAGRSVKTHQAAQHRDFEDSFLAFLCETLPPLSLKQTAARHPRGIFTTVALPLVIQGVTKSPFDFYLRWRHKEGGY